MDGHNRDRPDLRQHERLGPGAWYGYRSGYTATYRGRPAYGYGYGYNMGYGRRSYGYGYSLGYGRRFYGPAYGYGSRYGKPFYGPGYGYSAMYLRILGYGSTYAPGYSSAYSSVCGYGVTYGTSCGYATGYSSTYSGAYSGQQGYYSQPNGYVAGTTGSYGAQGGYGAPAQTVTVTLTAHNMAFSLGTINVPAGAHVVVLFTNLDATPHNLAVYTDSSASRAIFRGQEITGPQASITYAFDAPAQAGAYFFRCDVHPTSMMGQFVVH